MSLYIPPESASSKGAFSVDAIPTKSSSESRLRSRKATVHTEGQPSADLVAKWMQEQQRVTLTIRDAYPDTSKTITGKINNINQHYNSFSVIFIKEAQGGIYLHDIISFDSQETVAFVPIRLDPSEKLSKNAIRLIVGREKDGSQREFVVNKELLSEKVPFFKALINCQMSESQSNIVMLSETLSPESLEHFLDFLEGKEITGDSEPLELDAAKHLYRAADFFGSDDLKSYVKEHILQHMTSKDIEEVRAMPGFEDLKTEMRNYYGKKNDPCHAHDTIFRLLAEEISPDARDTCSLDIEYSNPHCSLRKFSPTELQDVFRVFELFHGKPASIAVHNIKNGDLPAILESVKQQPQIQNLCLDWNIIQHVGDGDITFENAEKIGNCISMLPQLKRLRFSDFKMKDGGIFSIISSIARTLQTNATIEALDVSCTSLDAHGFTILISALRNNHTLTSLNATACSIGAGYPDVGPLLENTTLRELQIGNNILDDRHASIFATVIRNNHTLQVLDMWRNRFTEEGTKTLQEALAGNSTLTSFSINPPFNLATGDTVYLRGSRL